MNTLEIEGDLAPAYHVEIGRRLLAKIRVALVTGGRTMLAGAGGTKNYGIDEAGRQLIRIRLNPLIARRLYTSGAELTEEEIADGLAQLRESDEDVAQRQITETAGAMHAGMLYAREQFDKALNDGDERALHKAWEMARKVNGLRKRLEQMTGRST